MKANTKLLDQMLTATKTALDGGKLYLFAGNVPADADVALDMAATHTQLAVITEDDSGSGLTFDAAVAGTLPKAASENWEGLIDFDGHESGSTTLTATFFRFCPAGDDGRDAGGTTARIQGTIGGPSSAADLKLTTTALTRNGSNTTGAAIFNITLTN